MIHIKNVRDWELKEWLERPNTVYIGPKHYAGSIPSKNSPWYNPYQEGTAEERMIQYRYRIQKKITKKKLSLEDLRNKTLICLCDQTACHAKVLTEMMNDRGPAECRECGDMMYFYCEDCKGVWCEACLCESQEHDGFTCLTKKMS